VLFGEWSILFGGVAVTTAVERRLNVSYRGDAAGRDFIDELHQRGLDREFRPLKLGDCSLDASELHRDGESLGLGSSAASIVGLHALAYRARTGDSPAPDQLLSRAVATHRRLQDGRGSGIDVATSVLGGTQIVNRGDFEVHSEQLYPPTEATAVEISANLSKVGDATVIQPVWTARTSSTSLMLDEFEKRLRDSPKPTCRVLERLAELTTEAVEVMGTNSAEDLVEIVSSVDETLELLGNHADIPIVTDVHRAIREAAEERKIEVKPSGAGGGDFSLAFGTEESDWDGFRRQLPSQCVSVDFGLGRPGLQVS
jgi:mevalonate kinase